MQDDSVSTSYVRFYFLVNTLPSSLHECIFNIIDTSSVIKFELRINSDGTLTARPKTGTGTNIGTGSTALSTGVWYRIELKIATGSSAAWEVWLAVGDAPASLEMSGTNDLSSVNAGRCHLGKHTDRNGKTVSFRYDDFVWNDYALPGPGQCRVLLPVGTGTFDSWTIGAGSGDKWSQLTETPSDGDATYLLSDATVGTQSFTIAPRAGESLDGAINAVKTCSQVKRNDAGATAQIGLYKIANATSYKTDAYTGTTSYVGLGKVFTTDPSTSSAWSSYDLVNGWEMYGSGSLVLKTRFTQSLIMVDSKLDPHVIPVQFIGRHNPARLARSIYLTNENQHTSVPLAQRRDEVYFIGKHRPSLLARSVYLTSETQDESALASEPETIIDFIGRHSKTLFARSLFLVQEPHDDSAPPAEHREETYSIGVFHPDSLARSVYLTNESQDSSAPIPELETNFDFIGRHSKTLFVRSLFLTQEPQDSSAAVLQEDTSIGFIGVFCPDHLVRSVYLTNETQDYSAPPAEHREETYSIGVFRPDRLARSVYLTNETQDETAPVLGTGVDFVGAFHSDHLVRSVYLVHQAHDSTPTIPLPEDVSFIGRFSPTKLRPSVYLNNELQQQLNAPDAQAETIISFIGVFRPDQLARSRYLLNEVQDSSVPGPQPETGGYEFIGRFANFRLNPRAVYGFMEEWNHSFPHEFTSNQRGQYRIQNLDAKGYLIYTAVNAVPDLLGEPADFSATLPLSVPITLPGEGIESLNVVARYRDSWGCVSQNSKPTIIMLDASGQLRLPVQPPINVRAYPKSGGKINVLADYPGLLVDVDPADYIRIWVAASIPNTNLTYTHQEAINSEAISVSFGSYSPGTYYVAVALYRSVDGAVSGSVLTTVVFPVIPGNPEAVFTENVTDP